MNIILYSTSACHLCEQAKEILWPVLEEYRCRLQEVDIADSDELLERYGVRIPVIEFTETKEELPWPFDTTQVRAFFKRSVLSGTK